MCLTCRVRPARAPLCSLWAPFFSGPPWAGQGVGLWGSFQAPGPVLPPAHPRLQGPFFARGRPAVWPPR